MSSFVALSAAAQPTDEAQHQAASLFDQGVREFAAQRYEAAAGSFLAADELRGSKEALDNALAAAQRGALPVLIARAASRLLAREDLDEGARGASQTMLDRVLPQLARIELRCTLEPCIARMDGEPARAGLLYAAPGAHWLRAENARGAQASARVDCEAGAVCSVELRPEEVPPTAPPAGVRAAAPMVEARRDVAVQLHDAGEPANPAARAPMSTREQLPLGVFIATTGGAATFAALTTWSGVKAVQARRRYESEPAAYDDEEVRRHARRADYFLAGTVLCAGGALLTGLLWADFGGRKGAQLALVPWPRGGVVAEGQF